jgi:uncharacterized protein YndB with AHSA1/START domain
LTVPDQIEKHITLRAPLARVWSALTDSKQFGAWFGCLFDAPFESGKSISGTIQPTKVDPEVAKLQAPHAGTPFQITIDRIEPMRVFSFRWHPYPVESSADAASAPTTLVMFELREVEAGATHLTITESGFSAVPLERRAQAFTANEGGWEHQTTLITKYLYGQTA